MDGKGEREGDKIEGHRRQRRATRQMRDIGVEWSGVEWSTGIEREMVITREW